ncbi:hypothetical protein TNCV_3066431 [Trichonephila clavipes]|uniref:Uncharacterized protein n=1 Tax=Trichonephila clavipes TaxID=2585209 RepID=A0A8X6UYL2_TRICX|nr:hypothetical protein TNCV_3066431 [Trichonephila clavipes]
MVPAKKLLEHLETCRVCKNLAAESSPFEKKIYVVSKCDFEELVPPDPRKYTALSCGRSDSALRSIWTAFRGQHMIDYAWDSQIKSIFHCKSQYDGDMTCVCSGKATFRTPVFGFPVDDPLARVVPIYRPLLSCPLL